MANYGFKTSNESPLQHEMRKENALNGSLPPAANGAREGCSFRRGLELQSHTHSRLTGVVPERALGEWAGAGAQGRSLLSQISIGCHSSGGCLAAGTFLQRKQTQLSKQWEQPELCYFAAVLG